jgi:hypothetical protein
MKLATVRNMIALLFALVVAGGSVASAGGAADYGVSGGAADYGVSGGAADYGV